MNPKRAFPILWALLLLHDGAKCVDLTSTTEECPCISEAKSERQEILANLLDLKSTFGILSGIITALDTRVRNIENLVKESEVKTRIRMDALDMKLEELNSQIMQEGQESQTHEQAMNSSLLNLEREINSTTDLIRGMEGPVAEVRDHTRAILQESREERANKSADPKSIDSQQETSATTVNFHLNESLANNESDGMLTGAERNAAIERILESPKAIFYKGENLTGEALNYDSSNTTWQGGCHNLNEIKSMRISGSCVRVFKGFACSQLSRALYPKSNSGNFINFLTPELSSVESVGPCLRNEFQFATVSRNGSAISVTKDESNTRRVPDVIDFEGWDNFYSKSKSISSSTNPVPWYYMDKGRPKWIYANIYKTHLKSNTGSNSGMNMAIPPELGGPMNRAYNTFNQTRKNFEEWKRITDEVFAALKQSSTQWVWVTVTFLYDSFSGVKPYGFYYRINTDGQKIVYGFIEN